MSKATCKECGTGTLRLIANAPAVEVVRWRVVLPKDGPLKRAEGTVFWHLDHATMQETVYFLRHTALGERLRANRAGERAAIRREMARETGEYVPTPFVGL